ncbi:methionine ABC transporter ATP-binding protein [Bacillus anthracis]|uniref:methionine ABC transporter ATP-binding protein n=2 Tax=Bacillaceae TaxID=186817 RepID=UPI0010A65374|nr:MULTISPECIES: ATP-binding cassette domain-containing protein [Bacillus]MCX9102446.1 ATP-binding cassette domain-containing protein [Bacillus anthracis]MDA1741658.1 ATP-binding cassette domain-containing protein [Bacillus cereus]QBJ66127.1 methionine ABC transporter ATP-binding protein [Bacillus anthracis]THG56144.1 ATP-binding cassette domain-containing protein [Bacillus sp. HUB-I-004]
MIELKNVSKVFTTKKGNVEALKSTSLQVKKGEVFGIIGYSGAGKSTLIRCVNLLEKPTTGNIIVNEQDLTTLSTKELAKARRKIGIIFQGFNLLKTVTVYENIALPLRLAGVPKLEIEKRVEKYLRIVDLFNRKDAYPSELSGGQKQRVAIARALSHEPEVLLSDEATSALDPETTDSILDLLLKINEEIGITILLITHEMNVIQRICDRVAVMEHGAVIESGTVKEIFTNPQHVTTKKFVNSAFAAKIPAEVQKELQRTGEIVTLSFIGNSSGEPALAIATKRFQVYPNILSGNITQLKHEAYGKLVIHMQGEKNEVDRALSFLQEQGIIVEGGRTDYGKQVLFG